MRRLGTALHVSKSGRLIVRAECAAPLMSKVYGPDLRAIGVVADVFGPVSSPYVAVKLNPDVNPELYVGRSLYFRPPMTPKPRRARRGARRARGRE